MKYPSGYKRVAWPPAVEERVVREFTPQPQSQHQALQQTTYQQQHHQQQQLLQQKQKLGPGQATPAAPTSATNIQQQNQVSGNFSNNQMFYYMGFQLPVLPPPTSLP